MRSEFKSRLPGDDEETRGSRTRCRTGGSVDDSRASSFSNASLISSFKLIPRRPAKAFVRRNVASRISTVVRIKYTNAYLCQRVKRDSSSILPSRPLGMRLRGLAVALHPLQRAKQYDFLTGWTGSYVFFPHALFARCSIDLRNSASICG